MLIRVQYATLDPSVISRGWGRGAGRRQKVQERGNRTIIVQIVKNSNVKTVKLLVENIDDYLWALGRPKQDTKHIDHKNEALINLAILKGRSFGHRKLH